MALICSDTHGNLRKVQEFLKYKPEEEHIHAGDILDSFIASDEDLEKCFNTLVSSECVLLWGNHELHYLLDPPFTCSGYRRYGEMLTYGAMNNAYSKLVEANKSRFRASIVRDGFIITHAGVHKSICKHMTNIQDLSEYFNNEMTDFLNKIGTGSAFSSIFNIGRSRGGRDDAGGIYWLDWKEEKVDKRFNQVHGHTPSPEPKLIKHSLKGLTDETIHVCVDSPKFICFNTKTREFEDFFPEEELLNREYLERRF